MTIAEIGVLAGAITGIAWVNWYFFVAEKKSAVASMRGAVQRVEIVVAGGYEPSVVRARRGVPLQLVFDRRDTSTCTEEVVLSDFGVRKYLPAHEKTTIDLLPETAGEFDFMCGMSMLHGKLVVEDEV